MGVFEQFPYTNFHDLNLDWVLRIIKALDSEVNSFIEQNVLTYANPIDWNITTQYAKNTVVVDPVSGTAYMSIAAVPQGILLTNTAYWQPIFNYKETVSTLKKQIVAIDFESGNAPEDIPLYTLFWYNNILYRAIRAIEAGGSVVIGTNAEAVTVEEAIKSIKSNGDLTRLSNGNIDDTASADIKRTAENIIDTATGDYTETAGDKTENYNNRTETVSGDILETVTGKKTVNAQDIILNPLNPLTYKTPKELNKYFKYVDFKDADNNYKVLVANKNISAIDTIFNVKAYGATGDGITDDTEAIKTCITDAEASRKSGDFMIGQGYALYFPAGTYKISENLTISAPIGETGRAVHTGVTIYGDGASASFIDGGALIIEGGSTHIHDISIKNVNSELNEAGIDFTGIGYNNLVENVNVNNCNIGFRFNIVFTTVIARCEALVCPTGFEFTEYCTSLTLISCYGNSCADYSYKFDKGCTYSNLISCASDGGSYNYYFDNTENSTVPFTVNMICCGAEGKINSPSALYGYVTISSSYSINIEHFFIANGNKPFFNVTGANNNITVKNFEHVNCTSTYGFITGTDSAYNTIQFIDCKKPPTATTEQGIAYIELSHYSKWIQVPASTKYLDIATLSSTSARTGHAIADIYISAYHTLGPSYYAKIDINLNNDTCVIINQGGSDATTLSGTYSIVNGKLRITFTNTIPNEISIKIAAIITGAVQLSAP